MSGPQRNGRATGDVLGQTVDALHAEYGRVSTDEQVDAGSIQNQRDFFANYRSLYNLALAGQYYDDGVSGTISLGDRPEGRRLLEDARAGRFKVVIVYKLDRLGRTLKALLEALEDLAACGVTIKSATEPFDTSTPIGTFMFQLLGGLAELERKTITERTTGGRDRVAKDGRYTGGPIPIGYDVDERGYFVITDRVMPVLGEREAEYVANLFRRIADGETTLNAERNRLSALRVPHATRYGGKKRTVTEKYTNWSMNNLASIIHSPMYKGTGRIESRNGEVVRPVPAIVDDVTWERAQAALTRNQTLARRNAKHDYLLRGLVRCAGCGGSYSGTSGGRLYRCVNMARIHNATMTERCAGADVSAHLLEAAVWESVRAFVRDPSDVLEGAQRRLRDRLATASDQAERARGIAAELAEKEDEKRRVVGLYRRGRISDSDADRELEEIEREADALRALLGSVRTRAELVAAHEAYVADVGAMLRLAQPEIDDVDRTDDRAAKRRMIELLAPRIEIATEVLEAKGSVRPDGGIRKRAVKRATVTVWLALRAAPERNVIASTTRTPGEHYDTFDAPPVVCSVVLSAPDDRRLANARSSKYSNASSRRRYAS